MHKHVVILLYLHIRVQLIAYNKCVLIKIYVLSHLEARPQAGGFLLLLHHLQCHSNAEDRQQPRWARSWGHWQAQKYSGLPLRIEIKNYIEICVCKEEKLKKNISFLIYSRHINLTFSHGFFFKKEFTS